MEALGRLLDRSLRLQSVDYKRRSRILIDTSIAIFVFNLFVTITLFGPLKEYSLAWATLVVLGVGTSVLPVLRLTGSVSIGGNILLSQTWALLHILTLYTGKIQGVPPAWIVFLPILAVHICNRGSALVWTFLAVVEIFVAAGLSFRAGDLEVGSLILYLLLHLGLLGLLMSTALLDSQFKDKTLSRLSRANKDLSVARDLALEASRAKSDFVANMSHELRTPLNAVIGYSEMLAEDIGSVEAAQMKQDLDRIKSSGQHLLRLINELLEFSKFEAGQVTLALESFRLDHLIQELVQTMEREAERNSNRLSFVNLASQGGGLVLTTDPTKLRQCLYNLLSNACKFTQEGQVTVTLRDGGGKAVSDRVVIEVEDSGIGMTPDQMARVFEPFVQAEASIARRYGGTGLGLSLSRKLAQDLGGRLEGFSEEGRGSRFVLTLPRLAQDSAPVEERKS